MIRIIQFGTATLQSRRRETAGKGGRPRCRFFSLLIVALLALPSYAHETDHHRITSEILDEIRELRDDVDDILEEIGNGNGNGNGGNYGAMSWDLLDQCADVIWATNYNSASRQSAKNASVNGCVSRGGSRSECTQYTTEFGSAYSNGTTHRCVALSAGGSVISGTGRCGTWSSWGSSETSARNAALGRCRSAGYSQCQIETSQCTSSR